MKLSAHHTFQWVVVEECAAIANAMRLVITRTHLHTSPQIPSPWLALNHCRTAAAPQDQYGSVEQAGREANGMGVKTRGRAHAPLSTVLAARNGEARCQVDQ
jgi:hypothetical protein